MRFFKRLTVGQSIVVGLVFSANLLCVANQSHAQSIELDKQLGAENAEAVAFQMGIYDHKRITEYVQRVGNRLVAELEDPQFEFTFQVADDPTPNAFALPGGYVYVTRGILALITSEDELACVMAHEIIHVTQRHSIKQLRRSLLPRLFEIPGKIVGKVVNEDLGRILNAPITMSNELILASYSRGSETESDELGVTLASKAGYDPTAMNDILIRLNDAVEFITQRETRKSYFDDHPFTDDRVDVINETAAKLTWQAKAPEADSVNEVLDGLLFDQNPNKGLFKQNVFLHPDLDFTMTFPDGWNYSNQPNAVGAVHPDRQAFLYLGMADPQFTPEEYAMGFIQTAENEKNVQVLAAKRHKVNDLDGYLVTVQDNTGSETTVVHQLWVELNKMVFQMVGAAPASLLPALKASADSLSALNDTQRKEMTKVVFRNRTQRRGESLETFNERVKSAVPANITGFLNGLSSDKTPDDERSMKVLVKEAYFSSE